MPSSASKRQHEWYHVEHLEHAIQNRSEKSVTGGRGSSLPSVVPGLAESIVDRVGGPDAGHNGHRSSSSLS